MSRDTRVRTEPASVSRVAYAVPGEPARTPGLLLDVVDDTAELLRRSGPLKFGQGMIATIVALTLAFLSVLAVLAYLVVRSIELPLAPYVRASAGIFGCCAGGALAGLAVSAAVANVSDGVRMVAIGITALAATV